MGKPRKDGGLDRGRATSSVELNTNNDVMCPVCDKAECELECEICIRWFHAACANVSRDKFNEIIKHTFHWYCESCDVAAVEIHGKIKDLQTENAKLKTDMKSILARVTKIEKDSKATKDGGQLDVSKQLEERKVMKEQIKSELKVEIKEATDEAQTSNPNDDNDENQNPWNLIVRGRQNSSTPNLREIIQEEMMERKKIDLIKKNLVISGVPESGVEAEDLEKVKEIILTELEIEAEIEKVERCGRTMPEDPDKPRLLKMFFKTQDNRKKILLNAKNLRNSENEHTKNKIYISPDQTKKQQLESKNL